MPHPFSYNADQAKIQGLSIQVGELFADLYRNNDDSALEALEAYKSLRRLLPKDANGKRHLGSTAAHHSTQGRHLNQFTDFHNSYKNYT